MSRFVNGAIIGLICFLLFLSLFWYMAEVRATSTITFSSMENRWGAVDSNTTELRSRLSFHNPHRAAVELVRLEHDVVVNGERVGGDEKNVSIRIQPDANGTVDVSARLPNAFLSSWWVSHVHQGEESQVEISGTATFLLMQRPVVVPYEWRADWKTNLASDVVGSLPNCAVVVDGPCIQDAAFHWATTNDAPQGTLRLNLLNANASSSWLRNWTTEVRLYDIPVARADIVPGPLDLAPESQQELDLTLRFDVHAFATWWPLHLAACEVSPVVTTVGFEHENHAGNATAPGDASTVNSSAPAPGLDTRLWTLPGQTFATHFVCAKT